MKTEYQTTIALVEEILAVKGDRLAVIPIADRLMAMMMEVFPRPQLQRDPEDAEMMVKERELAEEIIRKGSPFTDILAVPADDFLPQLYPMMVLKILLKDHRVPIDANTENFLEFYWRYNHLILFDRDGHHR